MPAAALAVSVLLPLAILLGTAWLFGWRFQPVETGSMAPAMPVGALAVIQPADAGRILPGATIVFVDPLDGSRLVAHRVVRQLPGNPPRWETQGDANAEPDPTPVHAAAVRGVVGWVVPGLGAFVTTIRGAPAVILLVILPLVVLVATEVSERRKRERPVLDPGAG